MTDIMTDAVVTDVKHFAIAVDPVTGEEVRVEIQPVDEFSQDAETEEVTVH